MSGFYYLGVDGGGVTAGTVVLGGGDAVADRGPQHGVAFGVEADLGVMHPGAVIDPAGHPRTPSLPIQLRDRVLLR